MGNFFNEMIELVQEFSLLSAFWVNIKLTLYSAVFAFLIGSTLAIMRISPIPSFRFFATGYVNTVRSIPLTLVILGCSLGLWGQLGVVLAARDAPDFVEVNGFRLAVLGLTLYTAVFFCEALRSGVNTIPQGQMEAARAMGLTFAQSVRHVVFPQAVRGALAPIGNTMIALAKNSTVAQAAGVFQAASVLSAMIEFRPDLMVATFMVIALGWVAIVLPIGILFTALSNKGAVAR